MAKIIYNGEYEKKAITDQFVENLGGMLEKDPDVIYLDADLMFAFGAGLWDLGDKYPERVIRCGIAEANMVGTAAAMSVMGMKPIIHSFASFITRRAFDQIFLSGAYGRKTLNIIGSEPGYKQTYWGGTHMAFEGIYYYRTPLADNIAVYDEDTEFEIGKGIVLREGNDASIIACGRLVTISLQAAELLEEEGIHVRVVDMFTIKPLDEALVLKCAQETGAIVTAENHSVYGGLGAAVAEFLGENDPTVVERIGTRDEFGEVGSEAYLRERFGFTPEKIAERVKEAIAKKKD